MMPPNRMRMASILKRLINEADIRTEVAALGRRIAADYRDRSLTVLGVLTGSIIFLSDLIRQMELPVRVGLIQASSYRGRSTQPGRLIVGTELAPDISGRDVLLIDDIFDTGQTLSSLLGTVKQREPNSVRSAVLLWKEGRQTVDIEPDYHCFKIPDVFVVGYGLDYDDEYRHLPYIATLDDQDL